MAHGESLIVCGSHGAVNPLDIKGTWNVVFTDTFHEVFLAIFFLYGSVILVSSQHRSNWINKHDLNTLILLLEVLANARDSSTSGRTHDEVGDGFVRLMVNFWSRCQIMGLWIV